MLPMEYAIITGLCLWAIALELKLRKRDRDVHCMTVALQNIALGKASVSFKNNRFTIQTNTGV